MTGFALISMNIVSAIENIRAYAEIDRARKIAERDLEIGRQIQAGFFPAALPEHPHWEIEAYFKPSRQVAGDFGKICKIVTSGSIRQDIKTDRVKPPGYGFRAESLTQHCCLMYPVFKRGQIGLQK